MTPRSIQRLSAAGGSPNNYSPAHTHVRTSLGRMANFYMSRVPRRCVRLATAPEMIYYHFPVIGQN